MSPAPRLRIVVLAIALLVPAAVAQREPSHCSIQPADNMAVPGIFCSSGLPDLVPDTLIVVHNASGDPIPNALVEIDMLDNGALA